MVDRPDGQPETSNDASHITQDESEQYHGLDPTSYTAQRLRHASAHHLHLTTRRYFIGPVPDDWIHSHRKSWYRSRLNVKDYTARGTTLSTKTTSFNQVAQHYASLDGDANTVDESPGESNDAAPESEPEDTQLRPTPSIPISRKSTHNDSDGEDSNSDATIRGTVYPQSTNTMMSGSFVTARESLPLESSSTYMSSRNYTMQEYSAAPANGNPDPALPESSDRHASQRSTAVPSARDASSTTSLIPHEDQNKAKTKAKSSAVSVSNLHSQEPQPHDIQESNTVNISDRARGRLARYNVGDNVFDRQQRIRTRIERTQNKISAHRPHWSKENEGEMVRAQKMLVRVEEAPNELPADYSENESLRMETREIAKWREYIVVCRKASDEYAPFTLKMYKSRVIQDIEKSTRSAYYEVPLNPKRTRVNLYSTLDKTVVMWHPHKRGTRIYIIRPRSSAHAVEWYTFIRQALGWHRPTSLLINVPDLSISLIFRDPFDQTRLTDEAPSDDDRVNQSKERLAADAITSQCITLLKERSEWSQVLEGWSKTTKMGLAWKRFDRLEWVHGPNEGQMYGTIAMQSTHDLELRPKHHYPSTVRISQEVTDEPIPVEGFLTRLTSQSGSQQRMGRKFNKRQYFYTQDHFLCFCRPAKAIPPHPSDGHLDRDSMPSNEELSRQLSSRFTVDPFPVQDNQIAWLDNGNQEFIRRQDENALAHYKRSIQNLTNADGLIDLCQVRSIQSLQSRDVPQQSEQNTDSMNQDETNCIFELIFHNDLVLNLQAHDKEKRDDWVKRLEALRQYWTERSRADANELRNIRQRNLKVLDIDERTESILGQFASKWEVRRAQASPHLYNMCHITGCRPIKISGQLYRKPRRHSTFHRCQVILTAGQLLIFQDTLRRRSGVEIPHVHKEQVATFDLQDCYVYSGILTESDLLYANQTFDNHYPGHHALPRIYLSQDGWTSRDEDTAICFVIWHPTHKSLFRASEVKGGKTNKMIRQVSALGVPGRSIVFKARSRIERDRWVLGIESEIDRLQEERGEDVRIV